MAARGKKSGQDGEGTSLPPEDARLWSAYAKDIRPLERKTSSKIVMESPATLSKKKSVEAKRNSLIVPERSRALADHPPQLDGSTERKLRTGRLVLDGTLDLHGMTREKAHKTLQKFILLAYARKARCLLVITGKGRLSPAGQGILKEKLPLWLSLSPLNEIVIKTVPAASKDGGSGAFYLYLKRQRDQV